jgi:septal ring factor EnvC (AmiA/AmiB activator)
MQRRTCTTWLASLAALGGCTVAEIRKDNERIARNVGVKELELEQAQKQQAEIEQERQRLLNDLRMRDLTLAEMAARLQQLEQRNAAALAATEEQRREQARRQQALAEARAKVNALERAPALPADDKARRLEEVRRDLRKTLELLSKT